MKENRIVKKLHSEKGAAAVLTLSVILLLTALGTVALVASALNVSMSGKVIRWTEEYYDLDTRAEEYVQLIDEELIAAESLAREYVLNRYDRVEHSALPVEFRTVPYNMTTAVQGFFKKHYEDKWIITDGINTREMKLQDYEDTAILTTRSDTYAASASPISPSQAYSGDLRKYSSEMFDRIYYYLLSSRFEYLTTIGIIPAEEIVIKGGTATPGNTETNYSSRCTFRFTNLNGLTDWNSVEPQDGDVGLYICVANGIAADPKEVQVDVNVILPEYDTIIQTINTPIFGNPIWANALSVQGNINIDAGRSVTVNGDVYAAGSEGFSVYDGANANIHGNVYTAGNLQVVGNAGRLKVFNNVTGSPVLNNHKKTIYGNDYFFDPTPLSAITISDYTGSGGAMPFIFNDASDRGNVYCKSLLVKEGVTDAELFVDGNLWTRDDVQMDGQQSTIRIGNNSATRTNYIGLNPQSGLNDPNESSSVINNFPVKEDGTDNSTIVLNSNIVIPGIAFYEFAGGNYYSSAESLTARATTPTEIINAYFADEFTAETHSTFTDQEGVDFELITPTTDALIKKMDALIAFANTYDDIKTNIRTDLTNLDGYVGGVALIHTSGSTKASIYADRDPLRLPHSTQIYPDYNALNGANALKDIFELKTRQLGTTKTGGFSSFIDPSAAVSDLEIYTPDSGTLNLAAGITSGIVYYDGNLTITGSGTFRGVIICTGDVTIQTNSAEIIYDESVISDKLKAHRNVRKFFEKGNSGDKIDAIQEYSSSSGTRTVMKRYKIKYWKEVAK